MYRIAVWSISSLGPFCWRVLIDCAVTWVPHGVCVCVHLPGSPGCSPIFGEQCSFTYLPLFSLFFLYFLPLFLGLPFHLVWSTLHIHMVWLNSDRPTRNVGNYMKKYFLHLIFTFYLNTDASVIKKFPCRCISIKTADHPWGRCWPIYLESKPSLNCWIAVERAEITFISIHINANQNSYHDDKSIL